jgi:hypothetical protein
VKGKEITADDIFVFNSSFSHKMMRIRVNTVQLKETVLSL